MWVKNDHFSRYHDKKSTTATSVSGETIIIDGLRTHLLFLANSVESLRNSHQLPEYGPHPIVYVVGAVVGAFVPTGAFVSRLCWWKNRIGSPVICKQNTLYHQSSSFLSTSYQFICVVFLRGLVFFDKNMEIKYFRVQIYVGWRLVYRYSCSRPLDVCQHYWY